MVASKLLPFGAMRMSASRLRSIAPAPRMLDALRSALAALEMADQTTDAKGAQIIVREAISKATGAAT